MSCDGQLLIFSDAKFHIYSTAGDHVTSMLISKEEKISDVMWTPQGNIVFAAKTKVTTVAMSGDVVGQTIMSATGLLSVSNDNVIYIADRYTGMYKSTNDGVTWSHVFNPPKVSLSESSEERWVLTQAIVVSTDQYNIFWTVNKDAAAYELATNILIHADDKRNNASLFWRSVTSDLLNDVVHDMEDNFNRLTYDGQSTIFALIYESNYVHLFHVTGLYERKIAVQHQVEIAPQCMAIDKQRHVMYVDQSEVNGSVVNVYTLTYFDSQL